VRLTEFPVVGQDEFAHLQGRKDAPLAAPPEQRPGLESILPRRNRTAPRPAFNKSGNSGTWKVSMHPREFHIETAMRALPQWSRLDEQVEYTVGSRQQNTDFVLCCVSAHHQRKID